jgi:hypothetical protein
MSATDDQVFVLRFWCESGAEGLSSPHDLRARVSYVNDGTQFHVSGIEDAFALVRSLLRCGHDKDEGQRPGYDKDEGQAP